MTCQHKVLQKRNIMFSQKDSRRVCITSPAAEQREEREMPDFKKLCPGCMREIKENENSGNREKGKNAEKSAEGGYSKADFHCPHCGFSESEYKQNPRCLPLNTILAGKYLVGKVLGEGGFGITYMGYDLNMETRIAIKEYFPVELVSRDTTRRTMGEGGAVSGTSASGGGSDRVISLSGEKSKTYQQGLKKYVDEARNISRFSGIPGIVSVKDFFYENDTAYIVMEYIEGVSLKEYLKQKGGKVSEEEALAVMRPMLEALEKVHEAGIVHRDISPDNIMLTFAEQENAEQPPASNTVSHVPSASTPVSAVSTAAPAIIYGNISAVKLIDFGAARMTSKSDQKSLTIILKHGYAPEEQYRSHGEQGPWTDVYALCAVFYRMITGKVPEPAMDRLFSDALKRPEELGTKVSPAVSEAIMRGLAVKKEDRIQSVRELMDAMYAGRKLKKKGKRILLGKFSISARATALAAGCVLVLGAGIAAVGIGLWGRNTSSADGKEGQEAAVSDVTEASAVGQPDTGTDVVALPEVADGAAASETIPASEIGQAPEEAETLTLEEKAYEPGEQIVWPKVETMIAGGYKHLVSLRDDGTVLAAGANDSGQCDVQEWESIAAVYAHDSITAGLRTDGTVVVAGREALNESVSSWRDVTMLALGINHILGLTQDGRVLSAGTNLNGCCETGDWENIVSVWADDSLSIGVTKEGRVKIAGSLGNGILEEEQKEIKERISFWTEIRQVVVNGRNIYGLREDGTVLHEGKKDVQNNSQIETIKGVISLAAGDGYLAVLQADGTVKTVGYCRPEIEQEIENWRDVVALTGTQTGLVCLKQDGTLLVTEPDLGGNSTMEEILSITDAVQAVWQGESLAVLCKDGMVRNAGYVEYWQEYATEVNDWRNVSMLASNNSDLFGLIKDGSVLRTEFDGISISGSVLKELGEEKAIETAKRQKEITPDLIAKWKNIKEISVGSTQIVGLLADGSAVAAGFPEQIGRVDYNTGLALDGSCKVDEWTELKQILALFGETIGLKTNGTLLTTAEMPEEWKQYSDIESIWGREWTAAAIRSDGTVVYLREGDDRYGQNNVSGWTDMVQLAVGENHTVGLRSDGTVTAVGDNFAGQCDVEDWTNIVSVAAGESGTVGITEDGRVLLAGTLPGDYFVAETWPAIKLPEE